MKTNIKTKDLMKLINPFVEGVQYKDENVVLDLNTLKEFVSFPKQKYIFVEPYSAQDSLYKNAALYIINSDSSSFISIDLNKKPPIDSGLFEYIKAIYKKETELTVSIPEIGDNLLLINSKNLKDDKSKLKNVEKAQDIEYANLKSIFSQTKKINIEEIKAAEKNQFFWQEDGLDLYNNESWVLSKISDILKGNQYAKDSVMDKDIKTIMDKLNVDLIESDSFKIKLLEMNSSFLNNLLLVKAPNLVKFDLATNLFQDFLMKDVKSNKFSLLGLVVEDKNLRRQLTPGNIELLINQPETINHLLSQRDYSSSYPSDNKKNLSVVFGYGYMSDENKRNSLIVAKYISSSMGNNMNNESYLVDSMIYEMPLDIFNTPENLVKILPYINVKEFSDILKKNNIKNDLLSDKDFLVKNVSSMRAYSTVETLNTFFNPADLDKKFLIRLIEQKPALYTSLLKSDYSYKFSDKLKDLEVIMAACNSGLKWGEVGLKNMQPHFLTTGTKEKEDFKLNYLVSTKTLHNFGSGMYDNAEDNKKFKDKYLKLEYMFFKVDDYFYEDKKAVKALSKIRNGDEIEKILNNACNAPISFPLASRVFYKSLHSDLKSNVEFLEKVNLFSELRFSDLSETLQYNKKILIKFIDRDLTSIPKEFFNDVDFSLELAKCLDKKTVTIASAPPLIAKFFDNQGVTSNYHDYLKAYISMVGISSSLEEKEDISSSKKMKI